MLHKKLMKKRAEQSTINEDQSEIENLHGQIDALTMENDRLMHMLSDPEILNLEIKKNEASVNLLPKDWALRLLVCSIADSISDAPNYIIMEIGNAEFGHFEVTVRRKYGKSPSEIYDERLAKLTEIMHDFSMDTWNDHDKEVLLKLQTFIGEHNAR